MYHARETMNRRVILHALGIGALLLPVCRAQSEIPPEVLQLARIKQNMVRLLARVPDYTCTETVQRFHRPAGLERFKPVDTFHMEVAYIGGKEVYSRPGASAFDDRRVSQIAGSGLTSDGEFAIQARTLFVNNTANISFAGKETVNGREMLRYTYRIALFSSGWRLSVGAAAAKIAEHGAFWADAANLELIKIERFADDIPPELQVSAVRTQLEYGKARLDGVDVSIPRSSETLLTGMMGEQDRNIAVFSQCHSVHGETAISFEGEPSVGAAKSPAPARPAELPPNLVFALVLESPIDSAVANDGDSIRARVARDVIVKKKIVVPKGAIVTGRVRRLERDQSGWVLWLEFVELAFDGQRTVFRAALQSAGAENLPGIGIFHFNGDRFHLDAGFASNWRTLKPL